MLRSDVVEYGYTCPYCWQQATLLLDLSVRTQTYTEDCEVCCRPVVVLCELDQNGDPVVAVEREG